MAGRVAARRHTARGRACARVGTNASGAASGSGLCRASGGGMKHAIEHIHMVGIGGAGMSGIAEVLINLGYR
ncbi:MAG: Mur ligase domain-containing protein, partial [Burkholderiaceae bacterium]